MSAFAYPPAVLPGDLVHVVAPSSPAPLRDVWTGLAWVRGRYRVRATPRLLERRGYLAGSDEARGRELSAALAEDDCKAVLAVRGGYGAMRLLSSIDWDALVRRPRWIVGFSDVTALHAEAWARGIASIHGPHVGVLGSAHPRDRAAWLAALERPAASQSWTGLDVVHGGEATGPIVGGNLTLLFAMAASGRLVLPAGAVLALEDTSERPYRVDRMLTALVLGRHLDRVAGVVLGGWDACDPGPDGTTVHAVIAERTAVLGIPVYAGAPFGHRGHNRAFVLGSTATMGGGTVVLGET